MPGENAPVDETGLINPDAFPCKPETLDPETIDSAGKSLRSMGVDIVSRTTAIRESWSRLPAIYESPEQEQVYSLMLKTTIPSFEIRAALVIPGSAIQDYASTMTTIKKSFKTWIRMQGNSGKRLRPDTMNRCRIRASRFPGPPAWDGLVPRHH